MELVNLKVWLICWLKKQVMMLKEVLSVQLENALSLCQNAKLLNTALKTESS